MCFDLKCKMCGRIYHATEVTSKPHFCPICEDTTVEEELEILNEQGEVVVAKQECFICGESFMLNDYDNDANVCNSCYENIAVDGDNI